jgi:hypothetical protein
MIPAVFCIRNYYSDPKLALALILDPDPVPNPDLNLASYKKQNETNF